MRYIQSLNIGKVIYELCKDFIQCYPVIADKGTEYPFLVYRRNGLSQDEDKDSLIVDKVRVELVLASKDYDESVELIQKVKDTLSRRYYSPETGISIEKTVVTGASESWMNDAYTQRIEFIMHVTA